MIGCLIFKPDMPSLCLDFIPTKIQGEPAIAAEDILKSTVKVNVEICRCNNNCSLTCSLKQLYFLISFLKLFERL